MASMPTPPADLRATAESEFRAYHLLSLMSQHGKFKGDGQAFLSTLQALRPEIATSHHILWVLKLQVGWGVRAGCAVAVFGLRQLQGPWVTDSAGLASRACGAVRVGEERPASIM